MDASSARIPVDPIEGLHVLGFLVTGLALLIVALGVGACLAGERPARGGDAGAGAQRTKEVATAERIRAPLRRLAFVFHRVTSWVLWIPFATARYEGSAKASLSMSTNTDPTRPTAR